MSLQNYKYWIALGLGLYLLSGCKPAGGNHPGSEYMPDMFHSIAFEANVYDYYYYNTWSSPEEYYQHAQPRTPVAGTIPFGQSGMKDGAYSENMAQVIKDLPQSGSVPFNYANTPAGREQAINEIRTNPFPITEEALNTGKSLYTIYCGICHGQKGDGLGYLVREDGGKYPVAPTDLTSDRFVDTSAGVYLAAIVHGKNVMGSYADKLTYKERWDVIHHIRSMQAENAGLKYTPEINNFLPEEAMTVDQKESAMATLGTSPSNADNAMEEGSTEDEQ